MEAVALVDGRCPWKSVGKAWVDGNAMRGLNKQMGASEESTSVVHHDLLLVSQKWLVPNDEKQRMLSPDVRTKSSGLYDRMPGGAVQVDSKQFCDFAAGDVPQLLSLTLPPLLNEIIVPASREGQLAILEEIRAISGTLELIKDQSGNHVHRAGVVAGAHPRRTEG